MTFTANHQNYNYILALQVDGIGVSRPAALYIIT